MSATMANTPVAPPKLAEMTPTKEDLGYGETTLVTDVDVDECLAQPQDLVVLPPDDETTKGETATAAAAALTIDLVPKHQATRAYARIKEMPPIDLSPEHAPGWGMVYFGVALPRVAEKDKTYQMPTEANAQKVAIQRLDKVALRSHLKQQQQQQDQPEHDAETFLANPFAELAKLQTMSQEQQRNLGLIEALQDDRYLYIVLDYHPDGSNDSPEDWIDRLASFGKKRRKVDPRKSFSRKSLLQLSLHSVSSSTSFTEEKEEDASSATKK